LVDVGVYGKISYGGTFERSPLEKKLSWNELGIPREAELTSAADSFRYVIVADEAFPLKLYLMHPYSKNSIVSNEEKVYKYRHSRARSTVENAFGILAGRWRVFLKPIETQPGIVDHVVLTACCLHNMLRNTKTITTFEERVQVENEVINGLESMGAIRRKHVREPAVVRDKFKKYLVSPREATPCPWQWQTIRRGRIRH
jgi:hypothetical protein